MLLRGVCSLDMRLSRLRSSSESRFLLGRQVLSWVARSFVNSSFRKMRFRRGRIGHHCMLPDLPNENCSRRLGTKGGLSVSCITITRTRRRCGSFCLTKSKDSSSTSCSYFLTRFLDTSPYLLQQGDKSKNISIVGDKCFIYVVEITTRRGIRRQ
jgi:hypothetical protein